jgi:tRNA/tmRNA/rRNA uracil-C5-methylase (TrmA/RlmC/RlmD family)
MTELKAGDRLVVTIHDIGFGGEGVARTGEFVLFIPFVAIGEEVEVEITELKKRFGRARLLKVLKESPARTQPECPYFGECGGCQYQHLRYETQITIKQKQIRDLFQRIGGFPEAKIQPLIPCPVHYGYRNRLMMRTQWNKTAQRLEFGFLRGDNRWVVDVKECKIAEPALNEQITEHRKNPPPRGGLKVVLRIIPENWDVPKDSFFQTNFFLLPKLIEITRECLISHKSRFLIDAYCGVGFFSLELADVVEQYAGVEVDAMAINAARHNAKQRGRENGRFVAARTEDLMLELLKTWPASETTLILDPPRTGCFPETLQTIRESGPNQVIYVSCHPATLARDLNILCADGVFELMNIVPLDMFPQTQHVECVADLRRRQPNKLA